jgi:hypothetical protein
MRKLLILLCITFIIFSLFAKIKSQIWEPDTRLTFDDSLSYFGYPTQWGIAADNSNRVHIVWYDLRDSQFASEVYYKRSTDNGATWDTETSLTTGSDYWQETPCIVPDALGRLHVVYTEFVYPDSRFSPIIHYKRSMDGGNSWGSEMDITQVQGDFAGHTSLASDLSNGVYVLFCDQTGISWNQLDNFFICSTNGGNTWGTPYRLTYSETALWGSIAADTLGRVHIVYVEAPTSGRQLYYRRSTDMGQSFQSPVQLTTASSNKFNGSVYTNRGDNVHIVWEDERDGNGEIYYIRSTDGGNTWGTVTRLTNDPNESVEANITVDFFNNVYCVWHDDRGPDGVYFKESTDGGNTWSNDTCITNGAVPRYEQFFPNIACSDSGFLHVAWKDLRDGNLEVYYKRRIPEQGIWEDVTKPVNYPKINVYPNPFTTMVSIKCQVYSPPKNISLNIYDVSGRLVKSFSLFTLPSSLITSLSWDGTNNAGRKLPPGLYFVHLEQDDYKETRKVILLH